nr:hypothetical protein [Nitrospiraceae bacterium]
DIVTYEFFLCTNSDFNGCPPFAVTAAGSASALAANLRGPLSVLLFSIALLAADRRKRRFLIFPVLASVMVLGLLSLASCGGHGAPAPSGVVQKTVSGLSRNTTYFWKVLALDGRGGSTSGGSRSFKTE